MSALGKPAIAVSPSSRMLAVGDVPPLGGQAHAPELTRPAPLHMTGRRTTEPGGLECPRIAADCARLREWANRTRPWIEIGRVFSIRLGTITNAYVSRSWWARGRLSAG